MAEHSEQLNEEQQIAVTHTGGPLLIVAGAGTGKTRVIVERINHLIKNNIAKPEEILALTFTEKAAHEMEERVDIEIPYGFFQMKISTFHSFADQILKEESSHIGLNGGYSLMTQAENILFMRKHLFAFKLEYFRPLGNPQKFIEALLQHFSRLRDEDISPETYESWVESYTRKDDQDPDVFAEQKAQYQELAYAYRTYQELKIKEGQFDFADLIYYTLTLFRTRPHKLQEYRNRYRHILVDEFQDTNIAQYELVKLLAPPQINPNLSVVGDDSQAIYKFRGASVSNIMTFMHDYPNARQVTLNKNYRSYQSILDASYKLIKHNDPDTLEARLGISKQLTAQKGKKKDNIHFRHLSSGEEEAEYVTREILEMKKKYGYKFSDFAVLVRANNHADPFTVAMAQEGVPYRFLGPATLFRQPEIKDIIAYMKVLTNLEDSVSMYRVLSMGHFGISQRDVNMLMAFAKRATLSLFEACEVYVKLIESPSNSEYENYRTHLPLLAQQTKDAICTIISMLHRHCELMKTHTGAQIVYSFLEDSGILQKLVSVESEKDEKIVQSISQFFNKLKRFEFQYEDASLYAVVDYIDMSMEMGESPSLAETDAAKYDAVSILTVHAAKGLEFPVVFLVNLAQGRFPPYEKREAIPIPQELIKEMLPEGDYHIEEERRLFYVGATRAMDYLYLTSASLYGDGKRERKVSPFVAETVGNEEVAKQMAVKQVQKVQLSLFDFAKQVPAERTEEYFLKNFSFSQLESYKMCPLQYKYQYLLKIPTPTNAAASFGDTIHRTLQSFYGEYIHNTSIGLERLLEIYNLMWSPAGYSSKAYQQKMKAEGIRLLTQFMTRFHPPHSQIISLEKLFKIKVSDDVFITGKIDRVDEANGEIEIIDYKTGKKPDDKELQKSFQLSIYALAATDRGLYSRPINQVNLTFYYLQEDDGRVTMKRTAEDLIRVKEEIITMATEIRKNEFKPKVGIWCSFCPFKMICDAWQR